MKFKAWVAGLGIVCILMNFLGVAQAQKKINTHQKAEGHVDGTRRISLLHQGERTVESRAKRQEKPVSRLMHRWEVESKDEGGTLLFSDSPEYVKEDGILYQDTVQGDARILYYHLNDTNHTKKVAVLLEGMEKGFTTVKVTRGGASEPSADYLKVGKATQVEYFTQKLDDTLYLMQGSRRLLQPMMDKTLLLSGQLVYGVYDFHASAPVKVSVIFYAPEKNPYCFTDTAKILPKDEYRLRGTFHGMNRIITSKKIYDPAEHGIVYFPLADNELDVYRTGIDATDGSAVTNYGNYGVLYKIDLPTARNTYTKFMLSPLGGTYAGAMRVQLKSGDSKLLMTPTRPYFGDATLPEPENIAQARREGLAFLTHWTELADLGTYAENHAPTFEFSPPGASNLPVNIILMPGKTKY